MDLRFYAREGHVVRAPGEKQFGQVTPAVGRKNVKGEHGIEHPAMDEPTVIDSASPLGKRIVRWCRSSPSDPPMWPADEVTAQACGLTFKPFERTEYGEYVERKIQPAPSAPSAKAKKGSE